MLTYHNFLLSLIFCCINELHAECGTDVPYCKAQPLSPQLQADVLALQKQSEQKVTDFLQTSTDLLPSNPQTVLSNNNSRTISPSKEPRLYIFVSLSMPEATLIELGRQAKKVDGLLVLRGLKDGSFKKTTLALKTFVEKTESGLIIDPILFKTFEVVAVPTFVTAEPQVFCPQNSPCSAPAYDKLTGHVSLDYALSELALNGDFHLANSFLKRLRGKSS